MAQTLEFRLAKWHEHKDRAIWGLLRPRHFKYPQEAKTFLKHAEAVHVFKQRAVIIMRLSPQARVRGMRNVSFFYAPGSQKTSLAWAARQIKAMEFRNLTRIGLSPQEDKFLDGMLNAKGFTERHEILLGQTDRALRGLLRAKNPPRDLKHLGLEVRALRQSDINQAIALQRRVFLRDPEHGFYSHTKTQLERDRKEYLEVIRKRQGLILGIFCGKKLLGFAGGFIKDSQSAGFSLCFHYSIQGKGVAKTMYRLLLEFFKKRKIKYFFGGTTQPAVKGLGEIMGRRLVSVSRVKRV